MARQHVRLEWVESPGVHFSGKLGLLIFVGKQGVKFILRGLLGRLPKWKDFPEA